MVAMQRPLEPNSHFDRRHRAGTCEEQIGMPSEIIEVIEGE